MRYSDEGREDRRIDGEFVDHNVLITVARKEGSY